ncbi:MAG TPA: YceI family protein [Bacteroidia bacterium]|nr:YceI family protein [Bacteroidia bacterium]
MKKTALLLIAVLATAVTMNAQIYKGTKTKIDFFSYTPMENISATDTVATMLLNSATGDVIANISIKGFVFPNSLMQEHFNENYMESDKYPMASFKGKINEKVDYTKDGVTSVTITGTLTCHGVAQPRTINATVTVKSGKVIIDSKFKIKLEDHKITVPEAVGTKIAESIDVTVHTEMVNASAK